MNRLKYNFVKIHQDKLYMLATATLLPQPQILLMDERPNTKRIDISSESSHIIEVQEQIIDEIKEFACSKKEIFSIRLALEEALANAIHHGNKNSDQAQVKVEFAVTKDKVTICITDQGKGFDSTKLPDPTIEANLNKPSGRGILLMRSYMDEVTFNQSGNTVTMVKKFCK